MIEMEDIQVVALGILALATIFFIASRSAPTQAIRRKDQQAAKDLWTVGKFML